MRRGRTSAPRCSPRQSSVGRRPPPHRDDHPALRRRWPDSSIRRGRFTPEPVPGSPDHELETTTTPYSPSRNTINLYTPQVSYSSLSQTHLIHNHTHPHPHHFISYHESNTHSLTSSHTLLSTASQLIIITNTSLTTHLTTTHHSYSITTSLHNNSSTNPLSPPLHHLPPSSPSSLIPLTPSPSFAPGAFLPPPPPPPPTPPRAEPPSCGRAPLRPGSSAARGPGLRARRS